MDSKYQTISDMILYSGNDMRKKYHAITINFNNTISELYVQCFLMKNGIIFYSPKIENLNLIIDDEFVEIKEIKEIKESNNVKNIDDVNNIINIKPKNPINFSNINSAKIIFDTNPSYNTKNIGNFDIVLKIFAK
jgi:hypothetical protein